MGGGKICANGCQANVDTGNPLICGPAADIKIIMNTIGAVKGASELNLNLISFA